MRTHLQHIGESFLHHMKVSKLIDEHTGQIQNARVLGSGIEVGELHSDTKSINQSINQLINQSINRFIQSIENQRKGEFWTNPEKTMRTEKDFWMNYCEKEHFLLWRIWARVSVPIPCPKTVSCNAGNGPLSPWLRCCGHTSLPLHRVWAMSRRRNKWNFSKSKDEKRIN